MKRITFVTAAASAMLWAGAAQAQVTVLDFEGVGNQAPVDDYYAAQGFTFSPSTLALVDSDAGGSGNFANEPSASTVMFFLNANNAILNANNGFTTGFSFFYSSSTAATVNIYDGLNATGNLLGSLDLGAQFNTGCSGDPTGAYCNWSAIGTTFAGIGRSIDFGGTANFTAFDDITFGSAVAGGIPEPTTWALLILGFAATGAVLRRARVRTQVTYA